MSDPPLPPIGGRDIIITDEGGAGPPPGTPPTKPPENPPGAGWSKEELEQIRLLEEAGVPPDRALERVKARRKPPGARELLTPTQQKKGELQRTLQAQGIILDVPQLNAFYDVAVLDVPPNVTWPQYIGNADRVAAVYRAWHDQQEAQSAEHAARQQAHALASAQHAATALAQQRSEQQQRLEAAELKDALANLKQRFPGNKNIIDLLGPELFRAWKAHNAQERDIWNSLPLDLQGSIGLSDVPLDTFLQGLDLGGFAAERGLGDAWQQGQFKAALNSQVFDVLRKEAKTPQEETWVEDQIAKIKATPALLGQFQVAQQETGGLKAEDWLRGDEAGAIIRNVMNPRMTAERQAQLQQVGLAYASRGLDSLQVAQSMRLGSRYGGSDEELQFVRSLPLDAVRDLALQNRAQAPRVLANGTTLYPDPNGGPGWVPATPTSGPFTAGGGVAPAGTRPGTAWYYMNEVQRQTLRQDMEPVRAQAFELARRGLSREAIYSTLHLTPDQVLALGELPFEGVGEAASKERLAEAARFNQGTTAGQLAALGANQGLLSPALARSFMQSANAGATGVLEQVRGEMGRAFERRSLEEQGSGALRGALMGAGDSAVNDAMGWLESFKTGARSSFGAGANDPIYQLQESAKALFNQPGGREYLQEQIGQKAQEYRADISKQLVLQNSPARWQAGPPETGGGEWVGGPATTVTPPPTFRNYITPQIPRIAGEFAQIQAQNKELFQNPQFQTYFSQRAQQLAAAGSDVRAGLLAAPVEFRSRQEAQGQQVQRRGARLVGVI